MHPDMYAQLVADRICSLRRDAETQRLAELATQHRRVEPPTRARQVARADARYARRR
jgi:hypothetical protein